MSFRREEKDAKEYSDFGDVSEEKTTSESAAMAAAIAEAATLTESVNTTGSIRKFERVSASQAAEIKRLRELMYTQFETKGTEHPHTLDTVQALAELLFKTLHFVEAEEMLRRALRGRSSNLGFLHTKEHDHYVCNNLTGKLALALCMNRKFAESEGLLMESLERVEKEFGYEHPETILLVESLAIAKRELGHLKESEFYYKRSLTYHQRVDGEGSEITLTVVNTLADLYRDMNDVPAALKLCTHSLEYCTSTLGPFHETTQKCVAILAKIRYSQGQKKEAEEMYRLAWACQEEKLGKTHDDTLLTMSRIAELLTDRGDWLAAELMRRDLLERCETIYGDDHPRSLEEVHHLGVLVLGQEQMPEAEALLRRCLTCRLEYLGDAHPQTNDTKHFVAKLLFIQLAWRHSPLLQARAEECETLLISALKHREEDFQKGPNHHETIDTVHLLADFYYDHPFEPRYKKAEALYTRVLNSFSSRFSRVHSTTNSVRYQLAVCRVKMRSFKTASPLFFEVHQVYLELFGCDKGSMTIKERELVEDALELYHSTLAMSQY